jgi:hypothetical protein
MSLTGQEKQRELTPEGMYDAICLWVLDLGTHDDPYNRGKTKNKIFWSFELPTYRVTVDRDGVQKEVAGTQSRFLNNSLGKKADMRKLLESWRGQGFTAEELKGFKYKTLVGVPCQLLIKHVEKQDGSIKDEITDILKPSEAGKAMKPEGKLTYFDFDEDEPWPEHIPDGITKIAMESYDWKSKFGGTPASTGPVDGPLDGEPPVDDDDGMPF